MEAVQLGSIFKMVQILTGSENIVRIWDAYAKNANILKMIMLMVL